MIANLYKFQVTLLDKSGSYYTNIEVKIENKKIKSTLLVRLLGVHCDDKLNFNHHIRLCKGGSKFSSYEIELRNRVTQNELKLRVTTSKIFIKLLLLS